MCEGVWGEGGGGSGERGEECQPRKAGRRGGAFAASKYSHGDRVADSRRSRGLAREHPGAQAFTRTGRGCCMGRRAERGREGGGWVGEAALGAGGWPTHARQACGPTPGRHMHPPSPAHAATSTRPPCLPLGQYPSRGPTQPMPATSNYPPNLQHTHRAGPRGECVHSWSGRSDVCVPAGAVQALLEVQQPPPQLWSMLSGRVGGSDPPRSRLPSPLPRTHC